MIVGLKWFFLWWVNQELFYCLLLLFCCRLWLKYSFLTVPKWNKSSRQVNSPRTHTLKARIVSCFDNLNTVVHFTVWHISFQYLGNLNLNKCRCLVGRLRFQTFSLVGNLSPNNLGYYTYGKKEAFNFTSGNDVIEIGFRFH